MRGDLVDKVLRHLLPRFVGKVELDGADAAVGTAGEMVDQQVDIIEVTDDGLRADLAVAGGRCGARRKPARHGFAR
jgi:hypothetical protein